ncbi:secretin receptor-like [Schistocerca gregaria]|uniref:secretin receptor-like n=1 Tax=Schistocerca gregaria TaxID=7010 RepID=UPI00211EC81F|nr:secretin receptor-like [Schistocerca gregaria]
MSSWEGCRRNSNIRLVSAAAAGAAAVAGEPSAGRCGVEWDGIACWGPAGAGALARQPCPSYVVGFRAQEYASKLCTWSGTWYRNEQNATWANYTLCGAVTSEQPPEDASLYESFFCESVLSGVILELITCLRNPDEPSCVACCLLQRWLPMVKAASQAGYAVSLVALLVAVGALSATRRLRCPRYRLYMHLFASFIFRSLMGLLKDALFVDGVGLASDVAYNEDGHIVFLTNSTHWRCKLVTSLWQLSIAANFSWILAQGLYLHNLVVFALPAHAGRVASYVALGWGAPVAVVATWAVARLELEDTLCWTTNQQSRVFLLLQLPMACSVLVSFALFLNLVRLLLLKVRASATLQRRRARYMRLARSTLVLVPLFGAHYALLLGLSYSEDRRVEITWLFADQLFASFQGLLVAVLYCLLNGEVRAEVSRSWMSWHQQRLTRAQLAAAAAHEPFKIFGSRRGSALTVISRLRTLSGSEDER